MDEDEQPEPIPDPEPVLVAARKRKSQEKHQRRIKQSKISEYMGSQKKAPKRKNNSRVNGNKATSQSECDRQMEVMENDGVGIGLTEEEENTAIRVDEIAANPVVVQATEEDVIIDLTQGEEDTAILVDGNDGNDSATNQVKGQAIQDNQMTKNSAIDFLQRFKWPTKRVFTFVQPRKESTNFQDGNKISVGTVGETTESGVGLKSFNLMPQPLQARKLARQHARQLPPQPQQTRQLPTKQLMPVTSNNSIKRTEDQYSGYGASNSDGFNDSSNIQKDIRKDEIHSEPKTKADNEKYQNMYVPSCIKAMFGSQSVSQIVRNQCEKEVHKKKDINFRYVSSFD